MEVEMETDVETENVCFMDSESFSEEMETLQPVKNSCIRRFSPAQTECLKAHYENGMIGASKELMPKVNKAAEDTGLTVTQVKQWIKKRNFLTKHTRNQEKLLVYKRRSLTPWQQFLKEYGQSDAGKEARKQGTCVFVKEASWVYNQMSESEKAEFFSSNDGCTIVSMKPREVRRAGAKIFIKIQKLFDELESLGYRALAVGFLEKNMHSASTNNCKSCLTEKIIDYLNAVTLVANPPPLIEALPSSEELAEAPTLSIIESPDLLSPLPLNSQPSSEFESSLAVCNQSTPSLSQFKGKYLSLTSLSLPQTVSTSSASKSNSSQLTHPTSGSTQPETASSCPTSGSTQPETASSRPTSGSTQLQTASSRPTSGSTQPQTASSPSASTSPETSTSLPSSSSNQPQGAVQSKATTTTPLQNATQCQATSRTRTTTLPQATPCQPTTAQAQTTTQLPANPQQQTTSQSQATTQLQATSQSLTTSQAQTSTQRQAKPQQRTATQNQAATRLQSVPQPQATSQTRTSTQSRTIAQPQTTTCLTSTSVVGHLLPTKSTGSASPSLTLALNESQLTESVIKAIHILLQKKTAAANSNK